MEPHELAAYVTSGLVAGAVAAHHRWAAKAERWSAEGLCNRCGRVPVSAASGATMCASCLVMVRTVYRVSSVLGYGVAIGVFLYLALAFVRKHVIYGVPFSSMQLPMALGIVAVPAGIGWLIGALGKTLE